MQLEVMPVSEELESAYAVTESYDYVAEEPGQRGTARIMLDRIEQFGSPPGRFLDLGCWVGYLLSEARERGWDVKGIEPSEFASEFARKKLGLDVATGDLFEAELEEGAYDVAFMGDVIEHMIDPVGTLERVRKLLGANGVVALALPDSGSRLAQAMGSQWWSVIPTHVQYFTRPSLGRALERAGFEPLVGFTSPKIFTVRYYLSRLGGYSEALGSLAVDVAERLGVADQLWAPDFRDRMLVIARRSSSHPLSSPTRAEAACRARFLP